MSSSMCLLLFSSPQAWLSASIHSGPMHSWRAGITCVPRHVPARATSDSPQGKSGADAGGKGEDDADDELDEVFLSGLEEDLRLLSTREESIGRAEARARARDPTRSRPSPLSPVQGALRDAFSELKGSYDGYSSSPSQQLLLGTLALLVGFYVSHGQVLGGGDQGGRWEYVSAGVAIVVVERLTTGYYSVPMKRRPPTLKLLHAFKVGFLFGCVLDAIKLAG